VARAYGLDDFIIETVTDRQPFAMERQADEVSE
jgi:hypothetical protein